LHAIDLLACAGLAMATSSAMLCRRLRAPLGADEGYLWYGVQQLRQGQWPHRDFKSYEPGRYLWCGLLSLIAGPGLRGLRIATHLFFALALTLALLAWRAHGAGWIELAFAAIALTALSQPQHKQFEHATMLAAWAAFACLWWWPSATTFACAAFAVGLALSIGFNLFLYAAAALVLMLGIGVGVGVFVPDPGALVALAGGGAIGLLPFLVACTSRGFTRQFYQRRVATVLARGQSNLGLPLPWPWRRPGSLHALDRPRQWAMQGVFLALWLLPPTALLLAMLAPARGTVLVPAAALGLFLVHHAASRADPAHITQSSAPACLLALQLCTGLPWLEAGVAFFALWLAWPLQRPRLDARMAPHAAGDLAIDTSPETLRLLQVAAQLAEGGGPSPLFLAPAYPVLYAWLGLRSPVYDTFALYPATIATQQAMIDGLTRAGVVAAIVSDAPVDGRDALRFSRTHPLVWSRLHEDFTIVHRAGLGVDVQVFVRHGVEPATEMAGSMATGLPATAAPRIDAMPAAAP
jgi:hypothetical protein